MTIVGVGLPVIVPVNRTFSAYSQTDELYDDDYAYWFRRFRGAEPNRSWGDLCKMRTVVIVGEAGIGKTFEFKMQADRLLRDKKPAFFLALNC